MHSLPIEILRGTPIWVYFVFALLLRGGLRQWQPRTAPMHSFLLMPVVFVAWGLHALLARMASPDALLQWLAMAAFGAWLAPRLMPEGVQYDAHRRQVQWPGSPVPMVRNLLLFGVRYAAHVLAIMQPAHATHWMRLDLWCAGLGAGYFVGWVLAILRVRPVSSFVLIKEN